MDIATKEFDAQMERIKLVTGNRTQAQLAEFFGVQSASIGNVKRRKKIPSDWLVILMLNKNVFPEWILTGNGPCFVTSPPPQGHYETGDAYTE